MPQHPKQPKTKDAGRKADRRPLARESVARGYEQILRERFPGTSWKVG